MSERLLHVLIKFDPVYGYKGICQILSMQRWNDSQVVPLGPGTFLESATLVVAYLLALVEKVGCTLGATA